MATSEVGWEGPFFYREACFREDAGGLSSKPALPSARQSHSDVNAIEFELSLFWRVI